jgi:N-acetylglucosaminyl-diphospho-decaprenol L-rhamnosyltransferase
VKLLAIIVNYRTPELSLRATATALAELAEFPDARITIVDNDSQDGSLETLERSVAERGWGERVSVAKSPRNGGFAWGVNFAARPALAGSDPPDYVYLLNSDARPGPGSIAELVRFLDAHPDAGIAGSYIHGPDQATHHTAFRFPSVASELEQMAGVGLLSRLLDRFVVSKPVPAHEARVDWLAGASMLIRRQVFDAVGLFDERYFLYFEETDFCLQAARAGWTTWYVPRSRVEHIGAASTGWKDFSKPRPWYWFTGRRYYFAKNHGRAGLWLANASWLAGFAIGAVWGPLRSRSRRPPRFLRDFLRHNLSLRPIEPTRGLGSEQRPARGGLVSARAADD